jgi:hypothetical protein
MIIVSRSRRPVRKRSRSKRVKSSSRVSFTIHAAIRSATAGAIMEPMTDEAGHLEDVLEPRGPPQDRVVVRRHVVAAGPLPQHLDLPQAWDLLGERAREAPPSGTWRAKGVASRMQRFVTPFARAWSTAHGCRSQPGGSALGGYLPIGLTPELADVVVGAQNVSGPDEGTSLQSSKRPAAPSTRL